jgi:hypothetical protein
MKNYLRQSFRAVKYFALSGLAALMLLNSAGCAAVDNGQKSHAPKVHYTNNGHAKPTESQENKPTPASLAQLVKQRDKSPATLPYLECTTYTARFSYCAEASQTCNDLFITYVDTNFNKSIDPEDELIIALHQDDPEFSIMSIKSDIAGNIEEAYLDFVDQDIITRIDTDAKSRQELDHFYNNIINNAQMIEGTQTILQ